MTPIDPQGPPSRLSTQLSLLGFEPPATDALGSERMGEERARQAAVVPKPLSFDGTRRRRPVASVPWGLALGGLLAAAAAVALYVRGREPGEPVAQTMGGSASITVMVDQNRVISTLAAATPLHEGARIRAEVAVPGDAPATAFWGVVSGDGHLLSDAGWIWQNRLPVAARSRAAFTGALELTGPNEGETLIIAVCAGAVPTEATAGVTAVTSVFTSGTAPEAVALGPCQVQRSPLR